MTSDLTVAVATHKPYQMPSEECYLPLHVGAALHPDVCQDMQQDDVGDNISAWNNYYSELTGLYWMWKNNRSVCKGLVHYRRLFRTSDHRFVHSPNRFDRIAKEQDFENILATGVDVIVPRARNYYIDTIGGHYRATIPGEQLDFCRDVLCDLQPKYVQAFDTVLSGRKAHMFNMLVARKDSFDAYCAWLFPVLAELCVRLNPARYDSFNARYPGRIGELLLDTWMSVNAVKWVEMPTVSPEPVDWFAKGKGFLAAKFLGKKYGKSF